MQNIASLLSGEAQTNETPSDSFSVTRRGVAVSSAPVVPPPPVPRAGIEGSSLDSDLSLSTASRLQSYSGTGAHHPDSATPDLPRRPSRGGRQAVAQYENSSLINKANWGVDDSELDSQMENRGATAGEESSVASGYQLSSRSTHPVTQPKGHVAHGETDVDQVEVQLIGKAPPPPQGGYAHMSDDDDDEEWNGV